MLFGFCFDGRLIAWSIVIARFRATYLENLKRHRSHRLICKRVAIVEKDGQKETVEKTISPSTVSRELNTLRAMLFEAKRNRWIQENPFREATSVWNTCMDVWFIKRLQQFFEAIIVAQTREIFIFGDSSQGAPPTRILAPPVDPLFRPHAANNTPIPAESIASNKLSVSHWRRICQVPAPNATQSRLSLPHARPHKQQIRDVGASDE